VERAERITSEANLWADMGSRARMQDVLVQARSLGLEPRVLSPVPEWADARYLQGIGETECAGMQR
jgi:hypothetical protein